MTERFGVVDEPVVVADELSRRSLMRAAGYVGGLVAASLLSACGTEGIPSNHGVSSDRDREEADARATADAVATVEAEQADAQRAEQNNETLNTLVLGSSKGAIANTIFSDLARKGSVFEYHKDSGEWRWSNPAAADDKEDQQTAVSASFDSTKLIIEKQAEVNGRVIKVRALCSLPENANMPAGINTKAEIRQWVDDNRSQLRVENLSYKSTPTDKTGALKGREAIEDTIEAVYDTANNDFDSISGDFDKAFQVILKHWSAIKDARP